MTRVRSRSVGRWISVVVVAGVVAACSPPVDWSANSPFELECEDEMREFATYDYVIGQPQPPSLDAALAEWEATRHPSAAVLVRAKFADQVAAGVAAYTGAEGKTRFVLRLQRTEDGWVAVSHEACAPPW